MNLVGKKFMIAIKKHKKILKFQVFHMLLIMEIQSKEDQIKIFYFRHIEDESIETRSNFVRSRPIV